ncbi:MAG: hypothetical protein Q4C88_06055 [Akkermansia sp.]|nr:hypothetical protein [Akkermansia sp.]
MTIGEAIDHALKIMDEIRKETGKDLELTFNTFTLGSICKAIEIVAYYKPKKDAEWGRMKEIFDRHILEVEGKCRIDIFFRELKQQMSFTDKNLPAPQQTCKDCKYFRPAACSMWGKTGAADCPACFQSQPKEQ